jgi:hypothetical protein
LQRKRLRLTQLINRTSGCHDLSRVRRSLLRGRHRPAALLAAWRSFTRSQRSSNRGASIRSAQAANAGVAPRQRNVSTFLKSGASVRRVASRLLLSLVACWVDTLLFRRRKHHHTSSTLVYHRWLDRRVRCQIGYAPAHDASLDDRARSRRLNSGWIHNPPVRPSETRGELSSGRNYCFDTLRLAGVVALKQGPHILGGSNLITRPPCPAVMSRRSAVRFDFPRFEPQPCLPRGAALRGRNVPAAPAIPSALPSPRMPASRRASATSRLF